jgi:hypothetical protein
MNEKQSKCGNGTKNGIAAENSAPGLNDNLEFLGRRLHVQTERTGLPVPRIVTQVFSEGRVVFSRKFEIPPIGRESQEFPNTQELMRTQHFETLREIEGKQKRILGSHKVLESDE